jgi:hypothetical protein
MIHQRRTIESCIDADGTCKGEVRWYRAFCGSDVSYPRCVKHYDQLIDWMSGTSATFLPTPKRERFV